MNLYELPKPLPLEEYTEMLHAGDVVRIERIISTGQQSGWYDQDEAEYVALLQGNVKLEYGDGSLLYLKAGDTVFIPAYQKHRVAYTSAQPPCIWLCIFYK